MNFLFKLFNLSLTPFSKSFSLHSLPGPQATCFIFHYDSTLFLINKIGSGYLLLPKNYLKTLWLKTKVALILITVFQLGEGLTEITTLCFIWHQSGQRLGIELTYRLTCSWICLFMLAISGELSWEWCLEYLHMAFPLDLGIFTMSGLGSMSKHSENQTKTTSPL